MKQVIIFVMKKYQKAEIIAKNLPAGSYAAGCGQGQRNSHYYCKVCERIQ